MATGSYLTPNHSRSQSEIQGDLHILTGLESNRACVGYAWPMNCSPSTPSQLSTGTSEGIAFCPTPVIENVAKITEIIETDRHVSSHIIAQKLRIDHKTVLSHLSKVGFKKKLDVWMPHQLTPKNMKHRISICEALAKRNEIDPFLKRMVTGDD
ncbi:histone-lysine N-methyltransferase SETMAR [Trichonephila clavipes]|nr:histone-lysine N-methyltransferase SETMAR [Trichonephila clavipes]